MLDVIEKKANLVSFDSMMKEEDHNNILTFIKEEMEKGNYKVFLQPKCNFNKILIEAEALIRYLDKETVIAPDQFIPFFEKMNVISHIDLYVFEEVCKKLREWESKNLNIFPISFNFSRETLMQKDLILRMENIRKFYTVSCEYLIIEITESRQTTDFISERKVIDELKKIGYHFSLDDFGVDYSNLRLMIEYPFTSIKIDKALIDIIETNWKDRILLENVISVCHEFGSQVIAEGVENLHQFDFLKEKQCDMMQGYFMDRPLPIDVFEQKYLKLVENGDRYEVV